MTRWLAGAAVVLVALACYAPTIGYGFTGWDDTSYIVNNPSVTTASELGRIWTSPESDQYYPLTFTSYWLEYRLWERSPAGYHATNVVLHALDALLVLLLLSALGLRSDAALAGALLFAVHPLQVMSVAWVAERKNLLACLFTMVTLLAWMRGGRKGYALALVSFAAALASKTSVLALPLALAHFDLLVARRGRRATVVRAIPMLLLSVAAALVTVAFEQKFVDQGAASSIPGLAERLQIAGAAPWFYLAKVILPFGLSPAYPLWGVGAHRLLWWAPLVVTGAGAIAFLVWVPRATGPVSSRVAWLVSLSLLLLAPSLGLIPFGNLALTYVSDHFLYISMAGLAGLAGIGYARLRDRFGIGVGVPIAIGVLLATRTMAYAPVFRSAESMWARVVEVVPDSYAGNLGLAELLNEKGRMAEAIPLYERAIAIRPGAMDAYLFFGEAFERENDPASAAPRFRQALQLAPGNVEAMVGLAWASEQTGAIDEALRLYEQAVRVAPRSLPPRMGLGAMYLGFARPDSALEQFVAAIEIQPEYARAYLGAATSLRSLQRHAEAVEILRRGLDRAGQDWRLLNLLALTLATAPEDEVRDGATAVLLAEAANKTNLGGNADLLDTLAAAYAEAGRFDDAVRTQQIAADSVERRRRTELYRAGKPLRLPAAQPAAKPLDQAH